MCWAEGHVGVDHRRGTAVTTGLVLSDAAVSTKVAFAEMRVPRSTAYLADQAGGQNSEEVIGEQFGDASSAMTASTAVSGGGRGESGEGPEPNMTVRLRGPRIGRQTAFGSKG
jgi:hypothetical protein